MNKKSLMIIIGILLWITAFSIWWPLILRFSVLLDSKSEVKNASEIISTLTRSEHIQIGLGAIAIVLGTALGLSGVMLKLGKRKITSRDEAQYAEILYDKVKSRDKN